jgi:anaerobic magnesium-protoporphyrin IX monomethyl ester cyclase
MSVVSTAAVGVGEVKSGALWPVLPQADDRDSLRVVLLSLNWHRSKDPRTPLGSAYLYSWLVTRVDLRERIRVGFIDHPVSVPVDRVVDDLLLARPNVLGIGVYVWNNLAVRSVLRRLRERRFAGVIVLGGPEVSYGSAELTGEFPDADYFVKGEGEVAFEEIVRASLGQREAVGPGIFSPGSPSFEGQAHLPPGTDPVQPQSIPELIPLIVQDGFGRVEFQRGCIFACSFCAFPFKDRVFRQLQLSTLRADLARLREAGVRELAILDPIFFVDKCRALMILRTLSEELPGTRFEIQSRLEQLDAASIEQISRMNVLLECGVQSLDPTVQRAIKRGGDPGVIEASLGRLRDLSVDFETHLIFGLPYQTLDSLLRDVGYLLRFRPRRLRLFPLLDHRGTDLSAQARTIYRGRLRFSDTFPRQIEATEWMAQDVITDLKRLYMFLEECEDPTAAQGEMRVLLERIVAAHPAVPSSAPYREEGLSPVGWRDPSPPPPITGPVSIDSVGR